MVHSIWWGDVIGALFIGLLSKVPREFILSILGKGGSFNGLLRTAGAGLLLGLCSHGILMVGGKVIWAWYKCRTGYCLSIGKPMEFIFADVIINRFNRIFLDDGFYSTFFVIEIITG